MLSESQFANRCFLYRVTHIEMISSKHLGGVEGMRNLIVCISLAARSRGLPTCVSSVFLKSSIGWPQQPPPERVSDISENFYFWWSIPWKGTSIGHFGARNDPTIRISKIFDEMRLSRSLRLLRSLRLQEVLRPEKSLLGTSESSRFLNSALF